MSALALDEDRDEADATCPRCGGDAFWEEERDDANLETVEKLRCIRCGAVLDITYSYG